MLFSLEEEEYESSHITELLNVFFNWFGKNSGDPSVLIRLEMKSKFQGLLHPEGCEISPPHLAHLPLREWWAAVVLRPGINGWSNCTIPILKRECQAGRQWVPFSLWYDMAGDRSHNLPVSGQTRYHLTAQQSSGSVSGCSTTELVLKEESSHLYTAGNSDSVVRDLMMKQVFV